MLSILGVKDVLKIKKIVEKDLGSPLSEEEEVFLYKQLKKSNDKPRKVIKTIIKKIRSMSEYDSYRLVKKVQNDIDQLEEKNITIKHKDGDIHSFFGLTEYFKIRKSINPQSHIREQHVCFNTNNLSVSNINIGENKATWQYHPGYIQTDSVSSSNPISNIVGLRVGNLSIRKSGELLRQSKGTNLLIEELQSQSFILHDRRAHFFFTQIAIYNGWVELHAGNGGVFWFQEPIQRINSFTFSFGENDQTVYFPFPFITLNISSSPAGSPTAFTTYLPHGLSTGNTVIFKNFTTADPVTDAAIITTINRSSGHVVTVTGGSAFTIAVDTSSITWDSSVYKYPKIICKDTPLVIDLIVYHMRYDYEYE